MKMNMTTDYVSIVELHQERGDNTGGFSLRTKVKDLTLDKVLIGDKKEAVV